MPRADLYGAINLGQGFPDFPAPFELKEAARRAIAEDYNQNLVTWGDPEFRETIAQTYKRRYGMDVDPETDVTVTCGSTVAMIAAMLGLVEAGMKSPLFVPFKSSITWRTASSPSNRRPVTHPVGPFRST